jgi:hypothetical protein
MLESALSFAIVAFVGVAGLGHVLVFTAVVSSAGWPRPQAGWFSGKPGLLPR